MEYGENFRWGIRIFWILELKVKGGGGGGLVGPKFRVRVKG